MTARESELKRIEGEFARLVRRVKRAASERAHIVHPDLPPGAYFMLAHLETAGPVRAADLAEALGHDKGGVSRHVQQLTDLGLIERQPDPEDRRAQLLVLTEDAHRRLEAMQHERQLRLSEKLSDWTAEDLAAFADQLARYNA